ncbi:hypothetical protein J6590_032873 [Homalodisca vitripennis]|nr:hypothetical protein J6590_032873 [Homalodisca vitripennis]
MNVTTTTQVRDDAKALGRLWPMRNWASNQRRYESPSILLQDEPNICKICHLPAKVFRPRRASHPCD